MHDNAVVPGMLETHPFHLILRILDASSRFCVGQRQVGCATDVIHPQPFQCRRRDIANKFVRFAYASHHLVNRSPGQAPVTRKVPVITGSWIQLRSAAQCF